MFVGPMLPDVGGGKLPIPPPAVEAADSSVGVTASGRAWGVVVDALRGRLDLVPPDILTRDQE